MAAVNKSQVPGYRKRIVTLEDARAMRRWWAENVKRLHDGEIKVRELRAELADIWKLHPTTVRNILGGVTHKDPDR